MAMLEAMAVPSPGQSINVKSITGPDHVRRYWDNVNHLVVVESARLIPSGVEITTRGNAVAAGHTWEGCDWEPLP
jgi:hypothetical protein